MKKLSILLTILTLILCFGLIQIFAQTKIQPLGNVVIRVGSNIVLQVPVNNKIPLLKGDIYREELSEVDSMFQIDALAVSMKLDEAKINFRVTNQLNSKKFRYITKEFNLKKGEKKTFNFKVKLSFELPRNYSVTVFYESKEINNEQPTTDN